MILETSALTYAYRSGEQLSFPDLQVSAGEKVLLVGASGSGKSSLLNLIAGVLPLQTGSISLKNFQYGQLSPRALDTVRANHIGVIFQSFNLIPYLSGFENAHIGLKFSHRRRALVGRPREVIENLATRLGLTIDLLDQKPTELSIGQQQRVAIVRALINSPALLLVDEPTSALDHANKESFLTLLNEVLDDTNCAMVFVSHDPSIGSMFDHQVALQDLNQPVDAH